MPGQSKDAVTSIPRRGLPIRRALLGALATHPSSAVIEVDLATSTTPITIIAIPTVRASLIDMIEIGSGGGSLARVDKRGLIRVGPNRAGVMSALGLLASPLGFEISRSRRILLADLDARIRAGVPRVPWAWSRIAAA